MRLKVRMPLRSLLAGQSALWRVPAAEMAYQILSRSVCMEGSPCQLWEGHHYGKSRMNKPFQISRRSFFKRCTAIAAATGLPLWFVQRELQADEPARRTLGPNDHPRIALIGCGGMGQGDAQN